MLCCLLKNARDRFRAGGIRRRFLLAARHNRYDTQGRKHQPKAPEHYCAINHEARPLPVHVPVYSIRPSVYSLSKGMQFKLQRRLRRRPASSEVRGRLPVLPIVRLSMQVHDGKNMNGFFVFRVNESVGETMGMEPSRLVQKWRPGLGMFLDRRNAAFDFLQELRPESRRPAFVPGDGFL